jgi:hypothetical protein
MCNRNGHNLGDGYFYVTAICRDNLEGLGFDVSKITDDDMEELADKMADDYLEQLYWSSMETIADEALHLPKVDDEPEDTYEESEGD